MNLSQTLSAPVEIVLNRYVRWSTEAVPLPSSLLDKAIAIRLRETGQRWVVEIRPERWYVWSAGARTADAEIEATLLELLALLLISPETSSKSSLRILGDTYVVQDLNRWTRLAGFDWPALLAKFTGGPLAMIAEKRLNDLRRWWHHNRDARQADLVAYLQEEIGLLPPALAVEEWMRQVDAIRDATARLNARLARLEATVAKHRSVTS